MKRFVETLEHRQVLSSVGTGLPVLGEATDRLQPNLAALPLSTAPAMTQLIGTIDWGDGSDSSNALFYRKNGQILVKGDHVYATPGKYDIDVTISRRPASKPGHPSPFFAILLGDVKTSATIRDDADGGVNLTETAQRPFTAKVGSFDFKTVDVILGETTIDWGDGTTSKGKLRGEGGLADGEYDVIGTHKYATTGTYQVHVVVPTHLAGNPNLTGVAADFFSTIKVMGNAQDISA